MPPPNGENGGRPYLQVLLEGSSMGLGVRSATVEDDDRLIDKATIIVDDPNRPYTDFVREGQTMTVEMGWETRHAVLFEGVVTHVEGKSSGTQRSVVISAYDLSYQMMQSGPRTQNHTGTLSTIIRSVVGEYGIPIGQIELDTDPEFTEDAPLRQTNLRDWQFIQNLARQYGGRAFVEYNDDASQFYFISEDRLLQGDVAGTLAYMEGFNQFYEFRFWRLANSAAPQRTTTTVDPVTGETVTTSLPSPALPEMPTLPDAGYAAALARQDPGASQRYLAAAQVAAAAAQTPADQRPSAIGSGAPSDPNLPERAAHRDPTRVLGLFGRGRVTGVVSLRAKSKVEIIGIAPWAEGEWYVKKAIHNVRNNSYETEFEVTR